MSLQGSIFKPRRAVSAAVSTPSSFDISYSKQSEHSSLNPQYNTTALELTKNEKYCVSKLPALPAVFENSPDLINAYSDHESKYSLVIGEDAIHVWSYKSTDPTPLSIQFPIEKSSLNPLAILTKPSSGTSQDPGLVIIDSSSGLVRFYESVQHAPALGLINNKSLELTIPINHAKGEYITLAENVEPAGIAVATSWKRCFLITLRDYKSKPQLSSSELLSNTRSKYFSYIFGSDSTNEVFDEIVSIRSGRITNHGLTQEIFILDSSGGFNIITYQLLSANGSSYVDKKKSYSQNLTSHIKHSIDGYLPGTNLDLNFLDLWPLLSHENIYIGLCYVNESYKRSDNNNLLLLTIKIDSTGSLLYGSHKLLRYDPSNASALQKPRLFLPKPGKTAFVITENSVIITDLNVSYVDSASSQTFSYYTPRWEDKVRFKSSVEVLGYGYEDKSSHNNPSVILLTKNNGILRIERFPDLSADQEPTDLTDPLQIIKSHIEQAIFYAKSEEIEFDISQEFSDQVIYQAISLIIEDLNNSSSPYIPIFLPSISDFLSLKVELFEKLIKYSARNFPSIWNNILPSVVDALEKTDFTLQLWSQIEAESAHSTALKTILEEVIIESKVVSINKSKDDVLRKFFSQGITSINEVVTNFIERLLSEDFSLPVLTSLVVQASYFGIFKHEVTYFVENPEVPIRKLWIFDTTLLIRLEQVFTNEYCDSADNVKTQKAQDNLIRLCEVLYYFVTSAINFMKVNDHTNDQLKEYIKWYKSRNTHWINALLKQNLTKEAISITEKYHDFSSLAQILEKEKKTTKEIYGENSFEVDDLNKKYVYYFERFRYEFASSLYDYYVKHDQIQTLLLSFTNYKFYLEEYLEKNSKKTSKFAWIRYLLDEKFGSASTVLYESASKFELGDNLDSKELKYSLAKLATIASRNNERIENGAPKNILVETENNLIKIKSQKNLFHSLVSNYGGEVQLLKFDNILKGFKNSQIGNSVAQDLLSSSFDQLVNNKQLNTIDLINWLTLLKPGIIENKGFGYALKVSALVEDSQLFQYYSKLVWLRLLTIGDDWSILEKGNLKVTTDEHTKQKIRNTVFFKTLLQINLDPKLIRQLESFLKEDGRINDEVEENLVGIDLNDSLSQKLNGYFEKYDFKFWIETIKNEAKR